MARSYAPRSWRTLRSWKDYLVGEDAVSLGQLMQCWRNGFYPDKARSFDFRTYSPTDYLPDGVGFPSDSPSASYRGRCADKVAFYFQLRGLGARTPEVFAENAAGRLILFTDCDDYEALLEARGELVIKPREGRGGTGVRIVRPGDADRFPEHGEFVSAKVGQHPYAAAIHAPSVNTIRVLTAWDEDAGDAFVAAAVHRFGTTRSGRVDNWSRGGVSAAVDLRTARLGPAIRREDHDPTRTWWRQHPDTGAQIEGTEVPGFAEMCRELLCVCRRFAPAYVGWDIVMTPDGWTIIEANSRPELGLFQVHRPLLLDPRLRSFYARERVI
jgi:hypothetical protein